MRERSPKWGVSLSQQERSGNPTEEGVTTARMSTLRSALNAEVGENDLRAAMSPANKRRRTSKAAPGTAMTAHAEDRVRHLTLFPVEARRREWAQSLQRAVAREADRDSKGSGHVMQARACHRQADTPQPLPPPPQVTELGEGVEGVPVTVDASETAAGVPPPPAADASSSGNTAAPYPGDARRDAPEPRAHPWRSAVLKEHFPELWRRREEAKESVARQRGLGTSELALSEAHVISLGPLVDLAAATGVAARADVAAAFCAIMPLVGRADAGFLDARSQLRDYAVARGTRGLADCAALRRQMARWWKPDTEQAL